MSENSKVYTLPEELKYAPKEIKEAYKKMCSFDDKFMNHPRNPLVLSDRHGDALYINCNAVYAQNEKKMKKAGITDKKDFEEVQKLSKELKELQRNKGKYTRIVNQYMTGSQNTNITEWKKQYLLEQFGEYKNIDQVLELLKEQGFSLQRPKLVEFYNSHLDDIKDRRVRFQAQEKDFYLATTTGRMESLSYLHSELIKLFDNTKNKGYAAEARAVLEQVRKEIKGDEIKLTVNGQIDFTATIQANRSIMELNQKIPINMFIISLVAGKRGVNPADIMAQLTNSFYSRWNGFNELADEEEDIKLPSHFIKNYDWQEIERIHKEKDEKATNMLFHNELSKFFKKKGIQYSNNPTEALDKFKKVCAGEAVSEIVDVHPIEIEVIEEEKPKILDAKQKLEQILLMRKKQLGKDEK